MSRLRRDQDVTDLRERDAVRRLAALAAAEAELLAVQREDLLRVWIRVSCLRRDEDVTDLGERDAVRRLAALAAAEAQLLAVQREDLVRVRVRIRGKG